MMTFNLPIQNFTDTKAFDLKDINYKFDSKLNLYAYNISENNLIITSSLPEYSLKRAAVQKYQKF